MYLRDLPQLVNVGLSVLMFLSAIFTPCRPAGTLATGAEPEPAGAGDRADPGGAGGRPWALTLYLGLGIPLSMVVCEVCFRMFQKARRGFADVM